MTEQQTLGQFGEDVACAFLESKGYRILERNFKCRMGEVDVISRTDEILSFAEVKLRKNTSFAEAREFVTRSKQKKLRLAAGLYLSAHPYPLQIRYDVIEVYAPEGAGGKAYVRLVADAFS